MEQSEILRHVDHTLLKPEATWDDIRLLCDDAVTYHAASVCVPPCYVRAAHEYLGSRMKVCTVIGFPAGYAVTFAKEAEARCALADGADELDMVLNVGRLKAGDEDFVRREIAAIKAACGSRVLKVIIEACLLTTEEKRTACRLVTDAGADYIKTSTGFASGGATFADVELLASCVGKGVRVKAAGGISSFADAERFLALGADRLGTSRLVALAKAGC